MIKIQEIKLIDILPAPLKNDKTMVAISKVLQKYLDENYEYIKRLNILPNIDNLTNEELIDHLAYQFHVDFYDPSFNLQKKRKLVKSSIPHHKKKGTKWAIEDLLSKAFDTSKVKEWFEYGGEPYYFRIHTKDILGSEEKYISTIKALNTVKNTRSWLEKIIVERDLYHNIYFGITNRQLRTNYYSTNSLEDTNVNNNIYLGISSRKAKSTSYDMNTIEDIKTLNSIYFVGICRRFKEMKVEVEHV